MDWLTKWPCCSVRSMAQLLQRAASGTVRDSGCSSRSDNSCLNDRFIFSWSSVWSLVIQISPIWIWTSIDFTYIHNLFLLKFVILFTIPHRPLCFGLRLFISVLTLVKVRLCNPSGITNNIIITIAIVLCFPHRLPSLIILSVLFNDAVECRKEVKAASNSYEMICETNLMHQLWFINQHLAQHVSGTIMPLFRSPKPYITAYGFQHLMCWLKSWEAGRQVVCTV